MDLMEIIGTILGVFGAVPSYHCNTPIGSYERWKNE